MHIAEMRFTMIGITDPPLLNAAGLHAPYALRIILELVTNDNIYGSATKNRLPLLLL